MKSKFFLMLIGVCLLTAGCAAGGQSGDKPSDIALSGGIVLDNAKNASDKTPEISRTEDGKEVLHEPALFEESDSGIIEIKDKMFVAQTNDIYYNTEDYLGKTIKYEGIFSAYEVPEAGMVYYSVIRYGPGCCGIDANAGFEVIWDGEYPKENDWVLVEGVLEEYEEEGTFYLRLLLNSLEVLPIRGEEYVVQ